MATTIASLNSNPQLTLNDGRAIPQLGFGVFQVPPPDTAGVVAEALRVGYRAIDTAAAYENEAGVGEAIAGAVAEGGLAREDVFVTTKLWNRGHGRDAARTEFEASLERLGEDYVDLYLIHWPVPSRGLYVETWQALVELHAEGRGPARSIGVSNFALEHLERAIEPTGVVPAVNQIELHPRFQQAELRAFHAEHGILTEAWSPLGQGAILSDPTVGEIAAAHGRTPAQVVLRWHLQLGNVVIPKSVTPARIEENFGVFDFELAESDLQALAGLDGGDGDGEREAGGRIGPDPRTFGAA